MSFCIKCGKPISDGAKFCFRCGTPVPEDAIGQNQDHQQTYQQQRGAGSIPPYQQPPYGQNGYYGAAYQPQTSPVAELSKKVKTEAIIWFCIAVYQIILGFVNLMLGD